MPGSLKTRMHQTFEAAIAFAPWVMSMYILYSLDYGEIWTTETAHRGKISVTILAVGMALSFLVQSHIAKRRNLLK